MFFYSNILFIVYVGHPVFPKRFPWSSHLPSAPLGSARVGFLLDAAVA